jgi:hypothetical protein
MLIVTSKTMKVEYGPSLQFFARPPLIFRQDPFLLASHLRPEDQFDLKRIDQWRSVHVGRVWRPYTPSVELGR